MSGEADRVRHAKEKGGILLALKEEYSGRATRVADLVRVMDLLGYPMTGENMQFSLQYLADDGYVLITRACDMPGFRRDRMGSGAADMIVMAKITPRGIRLIDGTEPENAGVGF